MKQHKNPQSEFCHPQKITYYIPSPIYLLFFVVKEREVVRSVWEWVCGVSLFFKQEDEGRRKCSKKKKKKFRISIKFYRFARQEFISWHKCTHETWRQPSSFIWDIFLFYFVILSLLSTINLLLLFIGVAMVPSSFTYDGKFSLTNLIFVQELVRWLI